MFVLQIILIDAVCEAEYHRPDRGDTIASFLSRHAPSFPNWLKLIITVRSQLSECTKQLPYTRICLDRNNDTTGVNVSKDLSDYIGFRLAQSPAIQSNVTAVVNGKAESSCSATQTRFATHLLSLANGSFLFGKLTLDLLESGHLVAKSASYKVCCFFADAINSIRVFNEQIMINLIVSGSASFACTDLPLAFQSAISNSNLV